jgi:hypothetical protein
MKQELKVGDRVACYGYSYSGIFHNGEKGVIKSFENGKLEAEVQMDADISRLFHVRGLAILIKKEKKKPREWWMNVYGNNVNEYCYVSRARADSFATEDRTDCVRVREVLE